MLLSRFLEALSLPELISKGKGKGKGKVSHHERPQEPQLKNFGALFEVLSRQEGLGTFVGLLEKFPEALIEVQQGLFPELTIIAPTDDAFKTNADIDINNATQMVPLIQYHILQGQVPMGELSLGEMVFFPTLLRNESYTRVTGGQNVAVVRQGMDDIVFVTGHHTRSGISNEIKEQTFPLRSDIKYLGGLINIVDSVLVPPIALAPTCRNWYKKDLTGFLGALYATGLYDSIVESKDLTIFAPSNKAWQIMAGTVATMSEEELVQLLMYHIVPGRVLHSVDMEEQQAINLTTQQGGSVTLSYARNDHFVDSAQVIETDVLFANGVIHVIDEVLNPQRPDLLPDLDLKYQLPAFHLVGNSSTGSWMPTPFTTALPCTSDCAATATATHSSRKKKPHAAMTRVAGAPAGVTARPEGAVAAAAVGAVMLWAL